MDSPPVPGDLLVDIFLRLADPADLIRASGACVSFGRLVADQSFLRRYRKLHAPPLLGFLDRDQKFHPAVPPHRSAPAASALAAAADFSFSFLPAPARDWVVQDSRDGRVLLDRPIRGHNSTVVCDPLHRRYLLLPPIPVALVENPTMKCTDLFLAPSGLREEAAALDETSFRVIWMGQCETGVALFAFSSNTGQWQAVSSRRWNDLSTGLPPSTDMNLFYSRKYVYGCFYWFTPVSEERELLVLDTKTMEFSVVQTPSEANGCCDFATVEAGEGRLGLFVLASSKSELSYFIRQNDGGSSSQWRKVKTISLSSWAYLICNMEKHLLLYHGQSSLLQQGCFRLDTKTFQLEKFCAMGSDFYKMHAYSNFPPSMLSSPTISSGVEEGAEKVMLKQGCAASSSAESPRPSE